MAGPTRRSRRGEGRRHLSRAVGVGAAAIAAGLLLGLSPSSAASQSPSSVLVAVGTHTLTLPWYPAPVMDGFNPAMMVSTDRTFRSRGRWTLSFGIDVGFFRDHWWMSGLSVTPEVRFTRDLAGGVRGGLGVGLGYLHYFWRRKTMVLRDGDWVEGTNRGRPSLLLPFSATLEYQGNGERPLTVSPLVTARWGVQGLFLREIPVLSHFSLLGGVRIRNDHGGGGA